MKHPILKFLRYFFLWSVMAFFIGCGSDEQPAPPEADFLISFTELNSLDVSEIDEFLDQFGITFFDGLIENPIQIFEITYKTEFQGDEIEASGLVVLPVDVDNAPIVSAQHGTITSQEEAPTEFSLLNNQLTYFELFSTSGFITFIPDYIGYGASSDLLHPYFLEEPTARATVDMIKAGLEFLDQQNVNYQEKLFLFGYSEGGYATLAAQKQLEANSNEINLSLEAVSAGAGGYYINAVLDSIISNDTYSEPAFLAFVVYAYQTYVEEIDQPLTAYFQQPYADRIPDLFNGDNTIDEINDQLTTELDELFVPSFLEGVRQGNEENFREVFEENSVYCFEPRTQMRMYHSREDEVIPEGTTVLTADTLRKKGTANIEVILFSGGTHFEAGVRTSAETLEWFNDLK